MATLGWQEGLAFPVTPSLMGSCSWLVLTANFRSGTEQAEGRCCVSSVRNVILPRKGEDPGHKANPRCCGGKGTGLALPLLSLALQEDPSLTE